MSSIIKKSFLIIITISAGVITLGLLYIKRNKFHKWKKEKEKTIDASKIEKEIEKSSSKNNSNTKISKEKKNYMAKSHLEITTSVSLELKRSDLVISKQVEMTIGIKVNKIERKSSKKNHSSENKLNIFNNLNDKSENFFFYIFSKFKDENENNIPKTPKKIAKSKINLNNTILNIIDELKNFDLSSKLNLIKSENLGHANNQNSLCLPNEINDLDEELNIRVEEIGFEECEVSLEEIIKFRNSLTDLNDTVIPKDVCLRNSQRKQSSIEKKKIESVDELNFILSKIKNGNFGKSYINEVYYSIHTVSKQNRSNQKVEIIKDEMFLSFLNHLFSELNEVLIELNDNCKDERRKYYNVDKPSYLTIINLFIRKREKLIYNKILEITTKLDISQSLLNDTIEFYIKEAEENEDNTIKIKIAYKKLLEAGIKTYLIIKNFRSIASKNLTKYKLKKILFYQLHKYEEYLSLYKYSVYIYYKPVILLD